MGAQPCSSSAQQPRYRQAWELYLPSHPDQRFAAYLRRGLSEGFRIGFDYSRPLKPARGNMSSVRAHQEVVTSYLNAEVAAGRMREVDSSFAAHKSPVGIIPKPHQPGKFRLIVDLSAPEGRSVNDGVSTDLCSLSYATVYKAVELVRKNGNSCMMAKIDLLSAYRHVPEHPCDQPLLCIEWLGRCYADQALPFGLRSAPKIFTAVADALSWAMVCEGLGDFIHYLDDFFFCGSSAGTDCAATLQKAVAVCEALGLPTAPSKVGGPATSITFLGIVIDSAAEEIRLPLAKLRKLRATLGRWLQKSTATKRDLQSLIGQLNHAASVVRPGRSFIRRLIEAMKIPRRPWHPVKLNLGCRADIAWWYSYISSWNGVNMFPPKVSGPTVLSDASGSWGAHLTVRRMVPATMAPCWQSLHIAANELLPVVLSAALWGGSWTGSSILFRSDNQTVIFDLEHRSSSDAHMAHLLRTLFFFEAKYQFSVRAEHIPGKDNKAADALSRGNLPSFFSLHPQAPSCPTPIPATLTELLMNPTLSWTSQRWRDLFGTFSRRGSPRIQ